MFTTDVNKDALNLSATTNRFSIRAVMATSGGTAAGSGTGTAGLDPTLVSAAPGLMIVFVGRKIRK
jgi:hypothetical protein